MNEKIIQQEDLCEQIDFELPVKDRFSKLAEYLFTQCALWVSGQYFNLQEIEFYYYGTPPNQDDFCIHTEEQYKGEVAAPFCFHQWGMDLMAGNKETKVGVLIRGIKTMQGTALAYGPCKLFAHILPQQEQYVQSKHGKQLKEMVNKGEIKLIAKKKEQGNICLLQGPRILTGQGPRILTGQDPETGKFAPLRYAVDLEGKDKGLLLLSSFLLGRFDKYLQMQMPKILKNYEKWWQVYKCMKQNSK